jgi:hypothetical protein
MSELSNYTMEVSWEQVDAIIKAELRSTRDHFEEELNKIEDDTDRVGIFSHDAIEDFGQILAHKHACELLLEYWGEKL